MCVCACAWVMNTHSLYSHPSFSFGSLLLFDFFMRLACTYWSNMGREGSTTIRQFFHFHNSSSISVMFKTVKETLSLTCITTKKERRVMLPPIKQGVFRQTTQQTRIRRECPCPSVQRTSFPLKQSFFMRQSISTTL